MIVEVIEISILQVFALQAVFREVITVSVGHAACCHLL
jgi:hypothetical protein